MFRLAPMNSPAHNPRLRYNGPEGDEESRARAERIVHRLEDLEGIEEVSAELRGGGWRVFGINARTQGEGIEALRQLLPEVDEGWDEVLSIPVE
jgi:hypothetical protein